MGPKTMSELVDSFEKIEFEQSALAAPPISDQPSADLTTSDQQSADLTTSDQHSSGKSSATTMNSSTDQAKTSQQEVLEFELGWKTRDKIIGDLNQHRALLSGLIVGADIREKMRKANGDLMVELLNLPLKVDGRSNLNEVVLYLGVDVKSRIIDTLVANQHALLEADSVSSERKAKLIKQNTDLAYDLFKLNVRTGTIPSASSVSKEDHLIDPTVLTSELQTASNSAVNEKELGELDNFKSSPTVNEVAILKEELKQLKDELKASVASSKVIEQSLKEELTASKRELAKLESELKASVASNKEIVRGLKVELASSKGELAKVQVQGSVMVSDLDANVRGLKEELAASKRELAKLEAGLKGWVINHVEVEQGLKKELAESKGELEKLQVRVGEVDVCRSEATVTLELKGIEELLAIPGQRRKSKDFTCGGISWYLYTSLEVEHQVEHLSVYLHCATDSKRWNVVTTFEVRLLSSSGAVGSDRVLTAKDRVFKNTDSTNWGWPRFIALDQLLSGSFIQEDTIKFRVRLTTKNFESFDDFE